MKEGSPPAGGLESMKATNASNIPIVKEANIFICEVVNKIANTRIATPETPWLVIQNAKKFIGENE